MIRLLVDLHSLDGRAEGITTYLTEIYRQAIEQGKGNFQFLLCATDIEHLRDLFGAHEHGDFVPIPHAGLARRLCHIYPNLIEKLKVDYAHFQYTIPFRCACRRVCTIHDVFFEDFKQGYSWTYSLPRHYLFRYAARHAELLFTMCDYSRKRIAHHYGVSEQRIGLTPNAVSEHFASDVAASRGDVKKKYGIDGDYILYLSRKEPRKYHVGLVRAFAKSKLWERGLHLALVGAESLPIPELETLRKELPPQIAARVHCIGAVDYDELCSWYRQAKAFAFPSLAEGFGIPPLEAAMCRLPVLCSNRTSMSEFDFFGDSHLDPTDEAAMIRGLVRIVEEPPTERLTAIVDAIQRRYSWKRSADALLNAIQNDYEQERTHSRALGK